MSEHRRAGRATSRIGSIALLAACASALGAGAVHAREPFTHAGRPIHPGCIHALAMNQGDRVPVTTSVSLEGCATSERSKSEVRYADDFATIQDDDLLGGGSFGYRVLNQLDNGIFGLIIRRVLPDGEERVSLAAVELVSRPMVRHGATVRLMMVELIGELWIPEMQLLSFQSIGNKVHFVSGTGPERVERTVDFTRVGRERR